MFRGFDTHLISRVDRCKGDSHYFSPEALRFFGAFGGASFALPHFLDSSRRFHVLVESVKNHDGTRHYRPTVVLFTPADDGSGETVEIFHPYDLEIAGAPLSGATATRRAQRYATTVRQLVEGGAGIELAAHRAARYGEPAL